MECPGDYYNKKKVDRAKHQGFVRGILFGWLIADLLALLWLFIF